MDEHTHLILFSRLCASPIRTETIGRGAHANTRTQRREGEENHSPSPRYVRIEDGFRRRSESESDRDDERGRAAAI
jgi:hypothetical protein